MTLQEQFSKPDRYGRNFDWTGYTVHDAAGLFLRYLKTLPEPVVPYEFYDQFTGPMHLLFAGADEVGPSSEKRSHVIMAYQRSIMGLPALSRQLLLYLIDLMAVIAFHSDINLMSTQRLVAHCQPALLAKPPASMTVEDHACAATVMIFLVDNQHHFLIGMPTPDDPSEEGISCVAPHDEDVPATTGDVPTYPVVRKTASLPTLRNESHRDTLNPDGLNKYMYQSEALWEEHPSNHPPPVEQGTAIREALTGDFGKKTARHQRALEVYSLLIHSCVLEGRHNFAFANIPPSP